MNIGIIGAGYIGNMHAHILKNSKHGTLTGIVSTSNVKAKQLANELNIRCYDTLNDMLADKSIEIIDVCTPTDTHEQIAINALEAGKHIIIEFPICTNEFELLNIQKYSEKYGKNCTIAYYSRFQSQYKYF